jgi:hypothetical protein
MDELLVLDYIRSYLFRKYYLTLLLNKLPY